MSKHPFRAGVLMPVPQNPNTMFLPAGSPVNGQFSSEGTPNLDTFRHALRRNWFWCVLLGLILGGAAGAGVWAFVPDRYTAFAELRAYSNPEQLLSGQVRPMEKYETFMSNMQQLIQSQSTLMAALRKEEISDLALVRQESDPVHWLAKELSVWNPREFGDPPRVAHAERSAAGRRHRQRGR